MYVVYHVDVGRCMSDKQAFRNQMQGAHEAPFPGQPENSVVAGRIMGTGQHVIQHHLQNGKGRKDCLVKEVIEIQLCPMSFNRDGRFMLSRTRQLLLQQVWNTSCEN